MGRVPFTFIVEGFPGGSAFSPEMRQELFTDLFRGNLVAATLVA